MDFKLAPSCKEPPNSVTASDLEAYAKTCGRDSALGYLRDKYGIDINPSDFIEDGKINWAGIVRRVIREIVKRYTGIDVGSLEGVIDANGNIDFREAFGTAGGATAYAFCSAYGAGAASANCAVIGDMLGEAIYNAGKTIVEALLGKDDPIVYQPNQFLHIKHVQQAFLGYAETGNTQQQWKIAKAHGLNAKYSGPKKLWNTKDFEAVPLLTYTTRAYALRSIAVATMETIGSFAKLYGCPPREMAEVFFGNGLSTPAGGAWANEKLFCSDPFGGWMMGTSPPDTSYYYNMLWPLLRTLSPDNTPCYWDTYTRPSDEKYGKEVASIIMPMMTRVRQLSDETTKYRSFASILPKGTLASNEETSFTCVGGYIKNDKKKEVLVLKSILWGMKDNDRELILFPDYYTNDKGQVMGEKFEGNTVTTTYSEFEMDRWLLLSTDDAFSTMLAEWAVSLEVAAKKSLNIVLGAMTKRVSLSETMAFEGISQRTSQFSNGKSSGTSTGTKVLIAASIAALGYGGFRYAKSKGLLK